MKRAKKMLNIVYLSFWFLSLTFYTNSQANSAESGAYQLDGGYGSHQALLVDSAR